MSETELHQALQKDLQDLVEARCRLQNTIQECKQIKEDMQEQHFNAALAGLGKEVEKKQLQKIAEENKVAVENKFGKAWEAPKAPDELTIIRMRDYATQLKKENKRLSKRQIRLAVKEKFNVTVFK